MKLSEIIARLAAIRTLAETATGEELDKLEQEAKELNEQRSRLEAEAERRKAILSSIAVGKEGDTVAPSDGGVPQTEQQQRNAAAASSDPVTEQEKLFASDEYRSAWLLKTQGRALSSAQQNVLQRAAVTIGGDAANVVPTKMANNIIELVKNNAPLFNMLTNVMHVPGNFEFAMEKSRTRAEKHAEMADVTPSGIELAKVKMAAYEIVKLVQMSASAQYMTIDGFESWLVSMLSKSMAEEINYLILYGTGSGEGTGIEAGNSWVEDTNLKTIGASATLSKTDIYNVCGMLPAQFDRKAVWLMSKKTEVTMFAPLQDKSKDDLYKKVGREGWVNGYPIVQDDNIPLGTAYLGDVTTIAANMPQNIQMNRAYDIKNNSRLFNVVSMFDCKPIYDNAFVKLAKEA